METIIRIYPRHIIIETGEPVTNGYSWQSREHHIFSETLYYSEGVSSVHWCDHVTKTNLTDSEVSLLGNIPVDLVSALLGHVRARCSNSVLAENERIERGRRDWAQMSSEERDALNRYSMETDGHSID